jgi:hypothetical protein
MDTTGMKQEIFLADDQERLRHATTRPARHYRNFVIAGIVLLMVAATACLKAHWSFQHTKLLGTGAMAKGWRFSAYDDESCQGRAFFSDSGSSAQKCDTFRGKNKASAYKFNGESEWKLFLYPKINCGGSAVTSTSKSFTCTNVTESRSYKIVSTKPSVIAHEDDNGGGGDGSDDGGM